MKLVIGEDIVLDIGENSISFEDDTKVSAKLPKTAIQEIAEELVDNKLDKTNQVTAIIKHLMPLVAKYALVGKINPIVTAVTSIYGELANAKKSRKKQEEKLEALFSDIIPAGGEPMYTFDEPLCIPDEPSDLDDYDLKGIRSLRCNLQSLMVAPVSIRITSNTLKKATWEGSKAPYFICSFDAERKLIVNSETHASHGASTDIYDDKGRKPANKDAFYRLVYSVDRTANPKKVYGRSKVVKVKR